MSKRSCETAESIEDAILRMACAERCGLIDKYRGADMDALKLDTVRLSADRSCLEVLDQTLLPGTVKVLQIDKIEDIFEAIRFLRVRGAPAIGVCAAYGIALTASRIETQDYEAFLAAFREQKKILASSRPTAVNLFWALDRMERTLLAQAGRPRIWCYTKFSGSVIQRIEIFRRIKVHPHNTLDSFVF